MNQFKNVNLYLLMLPAVLTGTLAMVSYGVTPGIWIQNILIWLLGTVSGAVFLIRNKGNQFNRGSLLIAIVIVGFLVLPFLFAGLDGVHRWITFGPVNIYVASILLPLLLIYLWKFALNNREYHAIGLIFLTLLILLFQPDAGQLTAFACATAILFRKIIRHWGLKIFAFTVIAALTAGSWVYLDDLAPVPYVEDILLLVADLGIVWLIFGILSLLLLLVPFFFNGKRNQISLSLGIYFLMTIIVTFFGNFPVPIMGYGISPIVGYLIAVTWLKKNI